MTNTTNAGIKMAAKFSGKCGCCGDCIDAGDPIVFFPNRSSDKYSRPAWHLGCSRDYHAEIGQDECGRQMRRSA